MSFFSGMQALKGNVLVRLTGYGPERFFNMCGKRNILIWDLKAVEEGYEFRISIEAYKRLRPILRKTKTKTVILEKKGLPFFLHRYRKRKMFLLGLVLFFGILIVTSRFVWNVEVIGNSYLSEETILDFLKQEDADFGNRISGIDCEILEEKLRTLYPEVIWVSVNIYGTKLTVELQESLLPEAAYHQFCETSDEMIYDIVAAKDGRITYMVTRHGVPQVKPQTQVMQGEPLVLGERIIYNDSGEIAAYLYETADADIEAEVLYDYQELIDGRYFKKNYNTEDVVVTYELQIGDYLWKSPIEKPKDTLYDVSVERKQLCLGVNYYLPVHMIKTVYKPYTVSEAYYTEEEAKQLAEEHFLQYLRNLEEKGIQIIAKNVMIKRVNQSYLVSGTITAEESIVAYQPTQIHSMESIKGAEEE